MFGFKWRVKITRRGRSIFIRRMFHNLMKQRGKTMCPVDLFFTPAWFYLLHPLAPSRMLAECAPFGCLGCSPKSQRQNAVGVATHGWWLVVAHICITLVRLVWPAETLVRISSLRSGFSNQHFQNLAPASQGGYLVWQKMESWHYF